MSTGPALAPMGVLLVDDHPVTLLGLRAALAAVPDLVLVAEASTADEAVRHTAELAPRVVILPIRLGGRFDGIELCRELKAGHGCRVLVCTSFGEPADAAAAALAGADGFVHRSVPVDELVAATRRVAAGEQVWLRGPGHDRAAAEAEEAARRAGLTPREGEVLGLMLRRRTNPEIARELVIEPSTVKTHVRSVLDKLGAGSRRELFRD